MTESFPDRICLRNPGCVQELAEKPVSSGALESRTALHCFAFLCFAGLEQPWRAARWVETGSRPNPPTEAGADSLLPILTILGKVTWYSKYQFTLFTKKLVEIAQMVKPLSFQNWIFYKKQLRNQHCCTMKRDLHRIQHYITTTRGTQRYIKIELNTMHKPEVWSVNLLIYILNWTCSVRPLCFSFGYSFFVNSSLLYP